MRTARDGGIADGSALRVPDFALTLLRCPACRAGLSPEQSGYACIQDGCGARFPVVDGVPLLLRQGSVYITADDRKHALGPRGKSRLQSFALRHLPTLERNVAAMANQRLLEGLLLGGTEVPTVLNLGGKHESAMAAALRRDSRLRCVEVDVALGVRTAVVCDPHDLPFEDGAFDAVLADAVLEHMLEPARVVAEVHRVLRPGGLVYSDVPFMLAVHGGRYDFVRFSALAHRRLFRCFDEIAIGVSAGPGAALAGAVQALLLACVESRASRFALKTLCRLSLFWLKYLDVWLARRPGALDAALGTFFVGRKISFEHSDREILAGYRGATPDLYEQV